MRFAKTNSNIFFNFFSPINPEGEKLAADETEKLVADLGSSAMGFCVNVADKKEVEIFFEKVLEQTGQIDVLVNNAGIIKDSLLVRMKYDDWDTVIGINLKGTFICTKLAAKIMMKQKSGRIINIASVVGATGNAGQSNYSASKAGIIGFTKSVAKELASRNITVNAVAPGFIETDMTKALSKKEKKAMISEIPMGRTGRPEDVAAAVEFLASEKAYYITGQVLHVSGGMNI